VPGTSRYEHGRESVIHNLPTYPRITLCGLLAVFSLSAAFLTGCSATEPPDLPLQDTPAFSQSGTEPLQSLWWQDLNDPQLNAYINEALESNFTLAAAWQRLRAARALARRESSDLYPDLDLGTSAQRQIDDGDRTDSFDFGPAASYEVDLWGKIRSEAQAEALRAQASEEAYRTAALSL